MSAKVIAHRTGEVIPILVDALKSLTWTHDSVSERAFDHVLIHHSTDWLDIITEHLTVSGRLCVIVPLPPDFSSERKGVNLTTEVIRQFAIMVCDQNYATPVNAYCGTESSPGAWLLRDLVVETLHGVLRKGEHMWSEVVNSSSVRISDKEARELNGRGGEVLHINVHCGTNFGVLEHHCYA